MTKRVLMLVLLGRLRFHGAVCVLAITFALTACRGIVPSNSSTDPSVRIFTDKVIKVGYIAWPPAVIPDPSNNRPKGHFIDTIEYIAKDADMRVEYHESSWSTFVLDLEAKKVDVVVAATYKTISRAAVLAWTRPLFYLGSSAIVKSRETRFDRPESLNKAGIRIAVTQGTGEHAYALEHLPLANVRAIDSTDLTLPFLEVLAGRADAALEDDYTVQQFAARHQNEVDALFVEKPFNYTAIAWAVRPSDSRLLQFLNDSIDYLDFSGRLTGFESRYGAKWLRVAPSLQ